MTRSRTRWPRSDGQVIAPAEFIPVAEATGLIVQLDRWVLNQACALASKWPDHLTVSSNLSAADFFAGDLVRAVCEALDRHGLAPHRLKLEITETVMLRDPARVRSAIRRLKDIGIRTVIDDFGAGNTSIAYLRDYDVSGLKIDRSLTTMIDRSPRSLIFVQAITDMATALAIETTFEGIETSEQLRLLREMNIGLLQGYLIGRPMTPSEVTNLPQAQGSAASKPTT